MRYERLQLAAPRASVSGSARSCPGRAVGGRRSPRSSPRSRPRATRRSRATPRASTRSPAPARSGKRRGADGGAAGARAGGARGPRGRDRQRRRGRLGGAPPRTARSRCRRVTACCCARCRSTRAAVYVPGGRAPYPSTVVMGAVTARAAGVATSSSRRRRRSIPVTLAACELIGSARSTRWGARRRSPRSPTAPRRSRRST